METPAEGGKDVSGGEVYTTSIGLGLPYSGSVRHSTAILDTGASANLVGVTWRTNHNAILKIGHWGDRWQRSRWHLLASVMVVAVLVMFIGPQ